MTISEVKRRMIDSARTVASATLVAGLLQGALVMMACTNHRLEPAIPQQTALRSECQEYWDAVAQSLEKLEQREGQSAVNQRELSEVANKAAKSPELIALLRCLSKQ